MKVKNKKVHLEIQKSGIRFRGVLRTTTRKNGKTVHETCGHIPPQDYNTLKLVQAALQGKVVMKDSADAMKIIESKEFGASFALSQLAKNIGLHKLIYSRPSEQWVKDCLSMIIGRIVYAGSKLALSQTWKDSALWEINNVDGEVDVDKHCYASMDRLLERQEQIQQKLVDKHLSNGSLVLYDITSSYFEGEYEKSEIAAFGYSRDKKRGHEQMVIGLICNEEGCPVSVEVFKGNTQDASTVPQKIDDIQKKYGVKKIIFVGDRGMVTHANYEKVKGLDGLNIISALTHKEIVKLKEREVIQLELFDEKNIVEVCETDGSGIRYCLCKNPFVAKKTGETRRKLLEKTKIELDKIANSKRKSTAEKIGARVGKLLIKTKMGKFIKWTVTKENKLEWEFDEEKIYSEKLFDGCYIIYTDVPKKEMNAEKIVASYKKLRLVENAFMNLKTVLLEIRPVYHKTDARIKSHIFICMLSYYLEWHLLKLLKPLFDKDKKGKRRRWTKRLVIERLKSIRRNKCTICGVESKIITEPDREQEEILKLIGIRL